MLLRDASSQEEVAQALEDGDEELAEDIRDKLGDADRWWDRHSDEYISDSDDGDTFDFKSVADNEHFIDAVIKDSPSEYDLSLVPRKEVEDALRYAATRPYRGRHDQWGPFYFDDGPGHFTYRIETQRSVQFPDHVLPKNAEFIPEDLAEEFWDDLRPRVRWDQTTKVEGNYGWMDGDTRYLVATEESFVEWCRDIVADYVAEQVKYNPKHAIEVLIAGVSLTNSALGEKLKKADLPDEELLDFAIRWFSGEDSRYEVLETLRDYFRTLESGVDEPREVIREWTQDDLRAMGIRRGPLFEEAPWRLIKLHPADLRLEGTLMRHCVGDKGMGYIKAVKDGEVEIWSLRSRANKPRFTLEVDSQFHAADIREAMADETPGVTEAELRSENIKQLKGKANRQAGFADTKSTVVKFPDEIVFWDHALRQLGADPNAVADLRDPVPPPHALPALIERARPMLANHQGEQCVGFDAPYRPLYR